MADSLAIGVTTSFINDPVTGLKDIHALGIPTVQLSYRPAFDSDESIAEIKRGLALTGIEITSLIAGYEGERYDDIPTVQRTVGLMPEETRAERMATTHRISLLAEKLGVNRLQAHIGYVPEDSNDPRYQPIVETIRQVCDDIAPRGQVFSLETGQETAAGLRQFILDVDRENLKVNFDPANMILYGNDKPIPALDILAPWIDGVHFKDGEWPTAPNQLGAEKRLGEGDVDIPAWTERLLALGYRGPLTIEREIRGEERRKDVALAKELIESLVRQFLNK